MTSWGRFLNYMYIQDTIVGNPDVTHSATLH